MNIKYCQLKHNFRFITGTDIFIMFLNQVLNKIVGFVLTLLICDTETIPYLSNKGELKESSRKYFVLQSCLNKLLLSSISVEFNNLLL